MRFQRLILNLPPPSPPYRRLQCSTCRRPSSACLCHCVQTIATRVQLLVLQHPMEVGHAKNTARLLHLCVPGSQLLEGEQFAPEVLDAALHGPWPGQPNSPIGTDTPAVRTVLLYPPTPPDPQLPVQPAPDWPQHWQQSSGVWRLVLLDGTWRKSRKMLYLNPALQQLPRLPLAAIPASSYAIRKAHAPDQLSSFEAGALALAQLEGWASDAPAMQQLMRSFHSAMAHHQQLQQAGQAPA